MFRDGLAALIAHTAGMHWVGASPDVRTAVVMTERLRPDVLLLDAALDPHCQFVRTLTSMSAALTIVAIVPEEERTTHYLTEAGSAGVHGLVLRSADPALFVECIRRAPLERRFLGPALRALRSESTEAPAHNARLPLSRREYQVLQLIAEGMDNQSIASSLFVSIETIRTHVKGILRKLHARDRAHAISLAYRTGVLSPTEDPHSTSSGGCDLV
jgi:DNA-binding NarL/FixJ family response regulator